MSTKSILVNFNGYPSTIDSLTPDNGLASLAGSLVRNGHKTLIMDFSTVDIIRRLIPDDIAKELSKTYEQFITDMRSSSKLSSKTIDSLLYLDKSLEEYEQSQLVVIADEIIEKARLMDANFIGFKLWTGDGFDGSVKIASRIRKEAPGLKLFAGGPHVDWFMENIFDHTDIFDALAYGEGEETIKLLADYAEGKLELSEIPNLIYKHDGRINTTQPGRIEDLNTLPEPIFDDQIYPAMKGDQKIKFIMIDESRGCPNACHFCIHPQKSGPRWRKRDPIWTVNLIEKLQHQLNTGAFRLSGSNTPADLKKEIASEIVRRGLKITYSAFGHARESKKEDYELLYKSGCAALAFGVESGSQQILDQDINKKVKVSDIASALRGCKSSGILAVASIIVPCPHDTPETIKETLDLMLETRPDSVTIQFPGLIPSTYWYKHIDDFGFELDDDYIRRSMTYSIKLLLPPVLWEPLPYKIRGHTHEQSTVLAQSLAIELEKNGILTGIGDFLLLVGRYLRIQARELRDKNRRLFFTGDYNEIENMVKTFNQQVGN